MTDAHNQLGLFEMDNPGRSVLFSDGKQEDVPMEDPERPSDVDESIARIRRAVAAVVARVKPLATVKGKGAVALADLARAVDALGDPATISQALSDTLLQARELIAAEKRDRASAFGKAIVGYLRQSTAETRETGAGWRVGPVELERKAEDGLLRVLYNREPLTEWRPVREIADIANLVEQAEAVLDHWEIATEQLASHFLEAFEHSIQSAKDGRVPLQLVLSEFRLSLVRKALRNRRRADARAALDMPSAVLLYNTDRYRAAASELPPDQRLRFETGGQRETVRIGVVLNGLEPSRQYETFCYVRRGAA